MEDAARTAEDFAVVVEEWNKLDRNRERRERITRTCGAMYRWNIRRCREPRIVPRWLNNPAVRQLCSGNFLDILFDCPYEMHQLTANAFLSGMIEELSEEHKEILYFLSIRLYSTIQLAQIRGQSDRNIRKVRNTIRKKAAKEAVRPSVPGAGRGQKPDAAGAAVYGGICCVAWGKGKRRCDTPGEQDQTAQEKSRP